MRLPAVLVCVALAWAENIPETTASCQENIQALGNDGGRALKHSNLYSQWHQDFVLSAALWPEPAQRPRVYIDLAVNDPVHASNSYFFDHCLGWRGICIEPDFSYHDSIRKTRSCMLAPTCIDESPHEVTFAANGGYGTIAEDERTKTATHNGGRKPVLHTMRCARLAAVLESFGVAHVDYLSLDIEGRELGALKSIDWALTTIDVMTVETTTPEIVALLATHGIVPVMCVSLEMLFVRSAATDSNGTRLDEKLLRWHAQVGESVLPGCLSRQTSDCLTTDPNAGASASRSFSACRRLNQERRRKKG